jgi:predicted GNAT family acetyltransferase
MPFVPFIIEVILVYGGKCMSILTVVKDPSFFLSKVESMLVENEAQNNLILGLLYRSIKLKDEAEDYFFAFVEKNDEVVLCFIKTPNKKLIMANSRPIALDEIRHVVQELLQLNVSIPGMIGEKQLVTDFVSIWQEQTNCKKNVDMEQLIYKLEEVNQNTIGTGEMRQANEQDIVKISHWIYDFSLVTPEELSIEEARNIADESVKAGTIFLWLDNGEVVSMARKSRPSINGIVISLVYTPKEIRKKGYASSLVASLSQHLLNEGYKFCSLYTDLANPTSNHIYKEIGYNPVAESVMYSFAD